MTEQNNVITDVVRYLDRFLFLGNDEKLVLAAFVAHTWTFDPNRTIVTPYVYINSPEKQCGKTETLKVLASVARESKSTSNITPSALYMLIDKYSPTLLLDECDAIFHGRKNEDLRGVINAGYKRGNFTLRARGNELKEYATFCPKVLAGINNGMLPDTIQDRCIPIILRRKATDVTLERFNEYNGADDALLDRLMSFGEDNSETVAEYPFKAVPGLSDRQSEVAWPLLAVGHAAGVDLTQAVVNCFGAYNTSEFNDAVGMLEDIALAIELYGSAGKIHTETLLDALGMPATQASAVKLADSLALYKIESKNVRIGTSVRKGYTADMFASVTL